jgi:energy-coupling factor transporter ATP-binding protein EcfA2
VLVCFKEEKSCNLCNPSPVLFYYLCRSIFQILSGLSKPTSGSIYIQRYGNDGNPNQSPEPLPPERVGIVFQFPERY